MHFQQGLGDAVDTAQGYSVLRKCSDLNSLTVSFLCLSPFKWQKRKGPSLWLLKREEQRSAWHGWLSGEEARPELHGHKFLHRPSSCWVLATLPAPSASRNTSYDTLVKLVNHGAIIPAPDLYFHHVLES